MTLKDWDWEKAHKRVPKLPRDLRAHALSLFNGDHTLFYKGRGYAQKVFCPVCQKTKVYSEREQYFPKSGAQGRCSYCGEEGIFRHIARQKTPVIRERYIFVGQRFEKNTFLLRGIKITLIERSPMYCGDQYNPMELRLTEHRRLYILEKGFKKEYSSLDWNTLHRSPTGCGTHWAEAEGTESWTTCGLGDQYKKYFISLHPDFFKNTKGTAAQYSLADWIFTLKKAEIDIPVPKYSYYGTYEATVWDYLIAYANNRKLEMLIKMGFNNLVYARISKRATHCNARAKKPWDYLKITPERFKYLTAGGHDPGVDDLLLYQYEKKTGGRWDDETCYVLHNAHYSTAELDFLTRFMTIKQLTNRLAAYAKKESLRQTAITYIDYLHMCEELGYDMNNSIYIYPRNLKAEHDKLVTEKNDRKAELRIKEASKRFNKIAERFSGAAAVYSFKEDGLLIRPAMDAGEIVNEGRILHHCVGGDDYLSKHNDRKSIILFIRREKKPMEPYITVEAEPNGRINQWYGIHDSKPDKEKIEDFLKDYCKQLDMTKLAKEAKVKIAPTEKVAI